MTLAQHSNASFVIACLGWKKVLQACFSMYDPKGQGSMDNSDFLTVVTMFHPYQYRGRTTRALREFDLPEDGRLSFGRLKELNNTFHTYFIRRSESRKQSNANLWVANGGNGNSKSLCWPRNSYAKKRPVLRGREGLL